MSSDVCLVIFRNINLDLLISGNLTIITVYLPVVQEVGQRPGIHLILPGGIDLPAYQGFVGPQTLDQLKGSHSDKIFLGAVGFSLANIMPIADIIKPITDQDASPEFVAPLKDYVIEVILV